MYSVRILNFISSYLVLRLAKNSLYGFIFIIAKNCHFRALCWDDSNVCLRASRCILLSWRKISEQADVVRATFGAVLRALCVWYENEAIIDCLLKVLDMAYKNCYQTDPSLSQVHKLEISQI